MPTTQTEPELRKGDPKPLPIGTRLSLRRAMPGTAAADRDKGWRVGAYVMKASGKWIGYELRNAAGEFATCSKFEAVDLEEA